MAEKKVQTKQETRRKTGFLFDKRVFQNLAPSPAAGLETQKPAASGGLNGRDY